MKQKEGILISKDFTPEPSMSWELFETKGKNWLSSGWSLDAITTPTRGGLGIAKDIYENKNIEIDIGGYLTQEYKSLWKGKFEPSFGLGLNIRF